MVHMDCSPVHGLASSSSSSLSQHASHKRYVSTAYGAAELDYIRDDGVCVVRLPFSESARVYMNANSIAANNARKAKRTYDDESEHMHKRQLSAPPSNLTSNHTFPWNIQQTQQQQTFQLFNNNTNNAQQSSSHGGGSMHIDNNSSAASTCSISAEQQQQLYAHAESLGLRGSSLPQHYVQCSGNFHQ